MDRQICGADATSARPIDASDCPQLARSAEQTVEDQHCAPGSTKVRSTCLERPDHRITSSALRTGLNAVAAGGMPDSAAAIPAAGRPNAARPEAAIRLCHQCASLDRVGTTRGPGLPTARAMARADAGAARAGETARVQERVRRVGGSKLEAVTLAHGDPDISSPAATSAVARSMTCIATSGVGLARGPVSPLIDGFCPRRRPFGDLDSRVDRPSRLDLGGMTKMDLAWRASSLRGNCHQPGRHNRSWANPSTAWEARIEAFIVTNRGQRLAMRDKPDNMRRDEHDLAGTRDEVWHGVVRSCPAMARHAPQTIRQTSWKSSRGCRVCAGSRWA